MTWRMARSLDTLLAEVNAAAPGRNKASDGGIGDAAHATRTSDHNPWVKDAAGVGVVRARDFTHDSAGGLDAAALAAHLAALLGRHPALGAGAYVIWARRIISTNRRGEGWRYYSGANPHTKHVHLSVGIAGYDSTKPWGWPPRPEKKDWFTMATKQELRDELAPLDAKLSKLLKQERGRYRKERLRDKNRFRRLRDLVKDNREALAELDALADEADQDDDQEPQA